LLAPLGIRLGGLQTLIRSLDTYSIGVGGDSHVRLRDHVIEVGPERVGAAMAYGGPVPTPTDALFVLGRMENGDRQKAIIGIQSLATGLDMPLESAAAKIMAQACTKILDEARNMVKRLNQKPVYTIHEIQEGYRLDPQNILILGGPAPFFCPRNRETKCL
jgi:N-methylhydantoinase A/oxoprolinase/acetone carboxylase beta subunit